MLHLVQSEEGYVTRTGMRFCAELLGLTTAEVTAVATFYSMYRRRPSGDYQVGVCTNTLCAVMGGDAIYSALQEHLGVGNGETTDDGKVTLEHIECNAACDFAPVVMVNWEFFDNQTVESAKRLVDELREGAEVSPTRGAPLCTFKETARILAGFPDEREGAVSASGGAGHASLTGLRLAKGRPPRPAWSTRARARPTRPRGTGPRTGRPGTRRRTTRRRASTSARTTRPRPHRRPTRPTRRVPSPRRGSDDLGSRGRRHRPPAHVRGRRGDEPRETARTRTVGLLGRGRVLDAGRLPQARGVRGTPQGARDVAGRPHRLRQGIRTPRPRRRRLPHRDEMAVHPPGRRQAPLSRCQRRRVGARDLQGHPAPLRQSAQPHRGHRHRVLRHQVLARVHLSAGRGRSRAAAAARGRPRGLRRRLPRQGHPGQRTRPRTHRARRRRRVHLR